MSPRPSRWPRSSIVALLLVSCGGAPCPQPVDGSAREVDRLVPVVSDPAAPPARRAEAVHGLGCMVARVRRSHSSTTAVVLTLGLSEIFAGDEPDLPPDRLPPVLEALGRVFCDPSREVSAAAERELVEMRAPVAAPALVRAARSCDGPRAVAAVDLIEERTVDYLKLKRDKDGHDPNWTELPPWGTAVQDTAGSDRPEVRARALAAKARIGAALDAFFADPDPSVRMPAARAVWQIEGSTAASLDRLAKRLRAGGPAPAGEPLDGVKLAGVLGNHLSARRESDVEQELYRLAHAGPRAAKAVDAIRACLAPEDPSIPGVHKVASAALAIVAGDRGVLPELQRDHDAFFANKPMAYGADGELVAQAILQLEPDDPDARAALGLEPGPLLAAVLRKALQDEEVDWLWWIDLLQPREASGPPRAP